MSRPSEPRWCRATGCDVQVILARLDVTERWVALEAKELPAFNQVSTGSLVVVDNTAWRPADLIEHFMTRFEIAEEKARDLVADYPFHRPHHHDKENPTT